MPKAAWREFIDDEAGSGPEDDYLEDDIDELDPSSDDTTEQRPFQPVSVRRDIFADIYTRYAPQPVVSDQDAQRQQAQHLDAEPPMEVDAPKPLAAAGSSESEDRIVRTLMDQRHLFMDDKLDSLGFFNVINREAADYPILRDAWIAHAGALGEWLVCSEGMCPDPPEHHFAPSVDAHLPDREDEVAMLFMEKRQLYLSNMLDSTELYDLIHAEAKDLPSLKNAWVKHIGLLGEWMEHGDEL
ncbi:hypothetical protein MPER_11756 [Moniliophthora perniciosa FA553]|nr:hypothetical protein MPER_11756 [Moniliophthora perniciosa FA553]